MIWCVLYSRRNREALSSTSEAVEPVTQSVATERSYSRSEKLK